MAGPADRRDRVRTLRMPAPRRLHPPRQTPRDATTHPATITAWYDRWPWAGVGILTGTRSGLVALDVDPRHDGNTTLQRLTATRPLPATLTAATGSGGRHYLYATTHPTPNTSGRIAGIGPTPGLDLLGDGGYIVAAPSTHHTTTRYTWNPSPAPTPAPHWLTRPATTPTPPTTSGGSSSSYAHAAIAAEVANVTGAPDGTRNNILNRAAFCLGTLVGAGTIDRSTVERSLLAAAHTRGPPRTRSESHDPLRAQQRHRPPTPTTAVADDASRRGPSSAPWSPSASPAPGRPQVGDQPSVRFMLRQPSRPVRRAT